MNTYVELQVTLWPIHPEWLAFLLELNEVTLWPTHPEWLAFLLELNEVTLWPTHPVRFFSALSLEKSAPSESA